MSGWWAEQFAHFKLTLTPSFAMSPSSKSIAAMTLSLDAPVIDMVGTPVATGEFDLRLDPSVSMIGVNYLGTLALNLTPVIGMDYTARSTGAFTLSLTPTISMAGAEHYTAQFALSLTPTIGVSAYIKQLPHPIPWTL